MPDFTLRIVSGAALRPWADPELPLPTGALPSRINPRPEQSHLYWRVPLTGATVVFGATVGGVDRPLDSGLGGRLFTWSWAEFAPGPPIIVPTSSKSSEATIIIPPTITPGYFAICAARDLGGAVALPFCVEP